MGSLSGVRTRAAARAPHLLEAGGHACAGERRDRGDEEGHESSLRRKAQAAAGPNRHLGGWPARDMVRAANMEAEAERTTTGPTVQLLHGARTDFDPPVVSTPAARASRLAHAPGPMRCPKKVLESLP